MAGEATAVIGPSVKLNGELSGTEDLEFNGEVDGSISLTGARLTVGAQGKVSGNVSAGEVVILGRVTGDIRAKDRAELRASAVVEGKVFSPRLSIEPGATLKIIADPEREAA